MANSWFLKQGGRDFGPFTDDQFKQLAVQGKIAPTDQVFNAARQQWTQASQIPGLLGFKTAPQFPSSAPSHSNFGNHQRVAIPKKKSVLPIVAIGIAAVLLAGGVGAFMAMKNNAAPVIPPATAAKQPPAPTITPGFRTQLIRYLEIAGELEASTSQGMSKQDLYQHLAKVKATYSVLEPMWPADFKPEAKKMNSDAIKGWGLTLRYWDNCGEMKLGDIPSADTPNASGNNGYSEYMSYAGDKLETKVWTDGDVQLKYIYPSRQNVRVLMTVASSHFSDAKSQLVTALAE